MSAERDAALRRIAIVLSSLPAPVSARLLGDLDPDAKQRLRRTMTSLADVDPLERNRALQAFSGTIRQRQADPGSDTDEIILTSVRHRDPRGNAGNPSPASHRQSPAAATSASSPATNSPAINAINSSLSDLAFLGDVEDDVLVECVVGEHPQTVALVLASIAPTQAARILPRLSASMRSDALSRIGRLGEIPREMIHEIATQLKKRVAPSITSQAGRSPASKSTSDGQRRLDAILAAMPNATQSAPSSNTSTASESRRQTPASAGAVMDDLAVNTDLAFAASSDSTLARLKVAAHTRHDDDDRRSSTTAANPGNQPWSTEDIHQHLLRLKPVQLRDALANVDTHDAILALCGLPTSVSDAVMSTLPKNAAKEIRHQIATIGPIELRHIDDAKERVAIASLPSEERSQAISMLHAQVPVAA